MVTYRVLATLMKVLGYWIYGAVMVALVFTYFRLGPNPALYEKLYGQHHDK